MKYEMGHIYHVTNRANELIFYNRSNYHFFLGKIEQHIYPHSNILAWCLMPNHFHLLLQATGDSVELCGEKHRPFLQVLSKQIGVVLSSYTQATNKARKRKGKLFAHNTKVKWIQSDASEYLKQCILYIHQNPVTGGLAENALDWEFSSASDYAEIRKGNLCKLELVKEIFNFDRLTPLSGLNRLADPSPLPGIFP